jgi:hypothetical protein
MFPALAVRRFLPALVMASGLSPAAHAQSAAGQPPQIVIGATVAERREAARALVPLLSDLKEHARPGLEITPGAAPPSPITGHNSTLFAFTVSRRSTAVDSRVVAAMDQLLGWEVGNPGQGDRSVLFDRWLVELQARSTAAVRLSGGGLCDINCVVKRMTSLDEGWGASPKGRRDARDELLLDALTAAVLDDK